MTPNIPDFLTLASIANSVAKRPDRSYICFIATGKTDRVGWQHDGEMCSSSNTATTKTNNDVDEDDNDNNNKKNNNITFTNSNSNFQLRTRKNLI